MFRVTRLHGGRNCYWLVGVMADDGTWYRGLLEGLLDGLLPATGAVGDDGPSADAAALRSASMFLRRWKPSPLSRVVTYTSTSRYLVSK